MLCETSDEIKTDELSFYCKKAENRVGYVSWKTFYPEYLKAPYYKYMSYFPKNQGNDLKILDLCCGMGEFSFDIAEKTQADVLATDISSESIAICEQELRNNPKTNLTFRVTDVEKVQLPEHAFDIICISGSLSYLNLEILLRNVKKWLKPEGSFVVVDTYGYSPFFNLKRKLNYLFGKTTKQTVLGIPKVDTINRICECFERSEVEFFGIFAFIGPFLKYIIGDKNTAKVINFLDKKFYFLKKYAFKFVLCGKQVRD